MEELFLETKNGNIPLSDDIIKKYNLKKGIKSPFSNERIVGKNGEYFLEKPKKEGSLNEEKQVGDGIKEMENGIELSTSEMLDIASGADSYQ